MARPALLLLAPLWLASSSAQAHESTPQPLLFADSVDVFEAATVDTGWLPAGSPLAVRFFIASEGGAHSELEVTSRLSWPDALTHELEGEPDGGWFALITDLFMAAQIKLDLWGFEGTWDIWSYHLEMDDDVLFDPMLLPGGETEEVALTTDGDGIDTVELAIPLFTGVDLVVLLDAHPHATASLRGVQVETSGEVVASAGEWSSFPVPEEDRGRLPLQSTYTAILDATLGVMLVPALEVCVAYIGCYEVAAFDIPVPLVASSGERDFPAVDYAHPLPALVVPDPSFDFGDVEIGQLVNQEVPLRNVGELVLEGTVHIEGDPAWSVFPTYFYASEGGEAGVMLTYQPEKASSHSALLVIESNDPLFPRLEIPLGGGAHERESGDGSVSAQVGGCGCAVGPAPAAGGWLLLAGLLGLIRRRR